MYSNKFDSNSSENSEFYTASAAVYSVLADLKQGMEHFEQYLKWCLDGVSEMNFDVLHEIHAAEIEMKPWKQIDWPKGMVDWTKIGFRCGDQVKVFVADGSIPKVYDKVNGVPQPHEPTPNISDLPMSDEVIPFVGLDNFFGGGEHLYGYMSTYNYTGYFDVDRKNRQFNFKRVVNNINKIYLEWISDGINPTGQTIIHPYAFKALQYYIHWQRKLFDDRFGEGERQAAQRLWEKQIDKVVIRNMNLSIEDIKDALRAGYKQTIKN